MGQLLVNVIFGLLNSLSTIIIAPIMALLSVFIPSLANLVENFTNFISMFWVYFRFVLKLMCVPSPYLLTALALNVGFWTFVLAYNTYRLMLKIYDKFKL